MNLGNLCPFVCLETIWLTKFCHHHLQLDAYDLEFMSFISILIIISLRIKSCCGDWSMGKIMTPFAFFDSSYCRSLGSVSLIMRRSSPSFLMRKSIRKFIDCCLFQKCLLWVVGFIIFGCGTLTFISFEWRSLLLV